MMKYEVQIRNHTSEKLRGYFSGTIGTELEYYRTLEQLIIPGEVIAKLLWAKLYLSWWKIHEL